VEVRGELYMPLSVFRGLGGEFSNPRNTTAGAIKQKDPSKTARYGLCFFVYDVRGPSLATEMDKVAWAQAHGLAPVETALLEKAEMSDGYAQWLARRPALDFELDGVVYKADRLDEQARLGATAHHPRYAIAYKFQGDSATSTLVEVQWSVSRTGTITPVGIIEPVELPAPWSRAARCTTSRSSPPSACPSAPRSSRPAAAASSRTSSRSSSRATPPSPSRRPARAAPSPLSPTATSSAAPTPAPAPT
jgi:NAD-dependent DNA ligase